MRFDLIFLIFLFKVLHVNAQTSLLSSGEWVKIGVVESGVYKIDKNFLQENKILTNNFDPKKIQVYGSGYNGALPQLNSLSNKINPEEIQLRFDGNSDNIFDNDEFIYFYLQSPDKIYFDSISNKIKTENYEALEASQTRYQGELEIQQRNFQRQVEKLKAKLESFEV